MSSQQRMISCKDLVSWLAMALMVKPQGDAISSLQTVRRDGYELQ